MNRGPISPARLINSGGRPRHRRCGAALLIAMVVLMILFAIGGALISRVIHARTQFQREEQMLQARWLVDAGLQRAIAHLNRDPAFTEEAWRIPAKELTDFAAAQVTLIVQPDSPDGTQLVLSVTAEYPMESPTPIRLTRQFRLPRAEPLP